MTTPTERILRVEPGEIPDAAARAALCLRDGGLALLPTESTHTLVGAPTTESAIKQLDVIGSSLGSGLIAWLTPSVEDAAAVMPHAGPAQGRLLRRLAPGPVIFRVEVDRRRLRRERARLGPAAIESAGGGLIGVRVSDHPLVRAVERAAGGAVVGLEVIEPGGRAARDAAAALKIVQEAGVEPALVMDWADGAGLSKPCTVIRMAADGGYEIEREGAYEGRFVGKQLQQTVLFVCSGNTCRSPMAEAIAGDLIRRRGERLTRTRVASAGASAGEGAPITPEAAAALGKMGLEPAHRGSRPLSRRLVSEADMIFTMTASHAASVLAVDGSAASKVATLDPSGADIQDPIGMSQDVYDRTAARIRDLVELRLKEIIE